MPLGGLRPPGSLNLRMRSFVVASQGPASGRCRQRIRAGYLGKGHYVRSCERRCDRAWRRGHSSWTRSGNSSGKRMHVREITSSLRKLWARFILVMVPAVLILALCSYWLTILLTNYSRSLGFLGPLPLFLGSGLIFQSLFAPSLKEMARKRAARRARDGYNK
jgi:hypothetical protein